MRNFVSLRYVKDNAPSIWKYLTEHSCTIRDNKNILWKGNMSEGIYLKYLSMDMSEKLTCECYVNPYSTLLFTIENNVYIDKIKELGSYEQILEDATKYNTAVYWSNFIPMISESTINNRLKYILEEGEDEGQGMDDAAASEETSNAENGNDDENKDSSETGSSAALGQDGAKEDADAKRRADIKFKIFTAPDKQVDDLKKGEKYLKIEYIYKDKKKDIEIDFLIGKETDEKNWSLYVGKVGSVSYDDDPYKSLKTEKLSKAINNAVEEVIDLIKEVEKDKDNWVQFYIHR